MNEFNPPKEKFVTVFDVAPIRTAFQKSILGGTNINKVKPDLISTGNIGCMMQIANGINIPIVHTVELIDWYTGGPKPRSLGKI